MNYQQQIKQILFDNDKSKTWLANKLHESPQALSYQLTNGKNLSVELYDKIMDILRKEGYITNDSERCDTLIKETLELDHLLGCTLTLLNNTIQKAVADKILEFKERQRISEVITKIRTQFNNDLDAMEKTIGI